MRVASGVVHQGEVQKALAKARSKLNPKEVRDVRVRIGTDFDGEPSLFFGVLLTAYGSADSRLADVTGRVAALLFEEIQPFEKWGLHPYFNFTADQAHFSGDGWV